MNALSLPAPLPSNFYDQDAAALARALLGKLLVRRDDDESVCGRIVETEAYLAENDPACHAARGRTRRNASMFGPPGRAYVYAIHARHCLNVVCEPEGRGAAVLLRALEPLLGEAAMRRRRGVDKSLDLTRGPGRLCQALAVDLRFDGWDLTRGEALWIAHDPLVDSAVPVGVSPRIGIRLAADLPLRFYVPGNRHVSGPRKLSPSS